MFSGYFYTGYIAHGTGGKWYLKQDRILSGRILTRNIPCILFICFIVYTVLFNTKVDFAYLKSNKVTIAGRKHDDDTRTVCEENRA